MAKGLDYAFNPHPSISAIKSDGASFVCRYISSYAPNDTNGKNLTPSEKATLRGAGIEIVVVAEEGSSRMLAGHSAGVTDAHHADAVVRALSMPGLPIYFACDFDATAAQQAAINAYLDGAASVIGHARTGIYGGYYPVKRSLDAGKVAYAWQTYAWSGGNWDSRAQLRQVQNGVTVGGASCDNDESMTADFGQWPRPNSVPAQPVLPLRLGVKDVTATGGPVWTVQRGLNKWHAEIGLKTLLATSGVLDAATEAAVKLALIHWNYSAAKVAAGIVDKSLYDHLLANPPVPPPVVAPVAPPAVPAPTSGTQDLWRWCHKCEGLFYGPNASKSHCPADGPHDMTGSDSYSLAWRRG